MAVPKYHCGRCGKKGTAEQMVYSRFSGNRYCIDLAACARRAANRKKRSAA